MLTPAITKIINDNANVLSRLDLSQPLPQFVVDRDKTMTCAEFLQNHMFWFQALCKERFETVKQKPLETLQDYYSIGNALNGLLFFYDQQQIVWANVIEKIAVEDPGFDISQFDRLSFDALRLMLQLRASLKLKLNSITFDTYTDIFGNALAIISPKRFALVESSEGDLKTKIFANFVLTSPAEGYYEVSDLMQLTLLANPLICCNGIFLTWNCYPDAVPKELTMEEFANAVFKPTAYLKSLKEGFVPLTPLNVAVCISHKASLTMHHFAPFLLQALVEITANDGYGGIDIYAPRNYTHMMHCHGFYTQDSEPSVIGSIPAMGSLRRYIANEPLRHFNLPKAAIASRPIYLRKEKTNWHEALSEKRLFSNPQTKILPMPFEVGINSRYMPRFKDIRQRELGKPFPHYKLALIKQPIDNTEIENDVALEEIGESIQIQRSRTGEATHLRLRALRRK